MAHKSMEGARAQRQARAYSVADRPPLPPPGGPPPLAPAASPATLRRTELVACLLTVVSGMLEWARTFALLTPRQHAQAAALVLAQLGVLALLWRRPRRTWAAHRVRIWAALHLAVTLMPFSRSTAVRGLAGVQTTARERQPW